mgnify:CR=1 FL=1
MTSATILVHIKSNHYYFFGVSTNFLYIKKSENCLEYEKKDFYRDFYEIAFIINGAAAPDSAIRHLPEAGPNCATAPKS